MQVRVGVGVGGRRGGGVGVRWASGVTNPEPSTMGGHLVSLVNELAESTMQVKRASNSGPNPDPDPNPKP